MMGTVLSIVMLAGLLLLVGAFALWRRGGSRKQVLLMVLLAVICFVNIAIWTVPDAGGEAPLDWVEQSQAG
ncbi:hypothetical protein [Altererythrobacter sp. C41]|uniref:hypothetical protein n=1 Tax=Altererythrobacter sp. C41 TaxID=2806021 RepID=UPI001931A82E|nr:hypothetical protein [Altererythrobacter sp. C41]MBM0169127.1 hypothetical protein [Altererythrobacter sp. C41]